MLDSLHHFWMNVKLDYLNRREHPANVISSAANKYLGVMMNSSKAAWIVSCFLANGTQHILNGDDNQEACFSASTAIFFQQIMAIRFHKTQATPNIGKTIEMLQCDEHTLVAYFRKHIHCKCLDRKYKEVKSITKIGRCGNPDCALPGGRVERKGILHCIRCRDEYYCSRDCQKANWSEHKKACNVYVVRQAALEDILQISSSINC